MARHCAGGGSACRVQRCGVPRQVKCSGELTLHRITLACLSCQGCRRFIMFGDTVSRSIGGCTLLKEWMGVFISAWCNGVPVVWQALAIQSRTAHFILGPQFTHTNMIGHDTNTLNESHVCAVPYTMSHLFGVTAECNGRLRSNCNVTRQIPQDFPSCKAWDCFWVPLQLRMIPSELPAQPRTVIK